MERIIKIVIFTIILMVANVHGSKAFLEDFETSPLGPLNSIHWNETYDKYQHNMWQVSKGAGRDGSQGVRLNCQAERGYSLMSKNGVTGTNFTFNVDFKITVNHEAPVTANDPLLFIALAEDPNLPDMKEPCLSFVRRDAGTKYAISINDRVPMGWERNAEIGLPSVLPNIGKTTTGGWFTMHLVLSDNGDDTWEVTGSILDEKKQETVFGMLSMELSSGAKTFYPNIAIDRTLKPLLDGGIAEICMDNISLSAE